ncbi:MAG: 30S ribosome-binding factor RbfA [Bacteroidetes bacterium]|nr:30S ribosome-binding factor RbfA [Bacteroidota bacterium]
MESTRQKKVARLVQKEMAEVFQRESRNLFNGAFITVTQARISPDLGHAKIYLSMFKVEKPQELLSLIKAQKHEIRRRLGEKVRHQLRIVPDLDFFIDDSLDYYENIDRLLSND